MDLDDFRTVLDTTGVDVWAFIDAAITVAVLDCGEEEVRRRRDNIVEKLYAPPSRCGNCGGGDRSDANGHVVKNEAVERESSPEEADPFAGLFDDEQKRILEIKEQLEDSDQPEDALVEMLQSLADMDITFKALQETDIGRNVNKLRKHPSNEVRRLVKHLVRKWKETVDEWVNSNQPGEIGSSGLMGGDSPQQKFLQNGHNQVPDFAYSPNPQNGSSGSDKNHSEPERKPKPLPRKEAPIRPSQPSPASASTAQNRQREHTESTFDSDRLASARKRLQENYKEAENAKKQRTIQVMDIHEIPKPKKGFFGRNRGGGSQGRHW